MVNIKKPPFNIIIIIFLVFALLGLYWLDRLGLQAGSAYLWLSFIGISFIGITTIAKYFGLEFWNEIPINKTNERATLMLFIGLAFLGIIYGASSFGGLNFYNPLLIQPLASFSLIDNANTFAALSTATSPFWTFFIVVLCASVIEEIVLGWGFVSMGSLVGGYGLRKLLRLDFDEANEYWDFAMAMIFSVLFFMILHVFNDSYRDPVTGGWLYSAFLWAAGFRLVLNMLIYKFGNMGLMFSIGTHSMHNAITLAASPTFGAAAIGVALTTFPGGVILDAILVLILFYGIVGIKTLFDEGELFVKDFLTFD